MSSEPLVSDSAHGARPADRKIYPFEPAVFIFRSARRRILVPCSSTGLARSAKTATGTTSHWTYVDPNSYYAGGAVATVSPAAIDWTVS